MARKAPFRERWSRRTAILNGRLRRTLPGAAPRHPSLFFHLPKCGGTSLSEAMYATIPFHERIGVIDAEATRRATSMLHFGEDDPTRCHEDLDTGQLVFDLREGLLLQHMAWDTRLIHGHVLWSEQAWTHFGDRVKYVTIMRDPIARTISNFRMNQRTGVGAEDLESYLEGPVARRHAQVFLRYLTGRNDIAADEVPKALRLAEERLKNFALIGFLDDTKRFIEAYHDLFGVRLRFPNLNAAPDRAPPIPEAQMARIEALCAPDIALYKTARELMAHQRGD